MADDTSPSTEQQGAPVAPGAGAALFFGWLFLLASVGLVIAGFVVAFTYDSEFSTRQRGRIVGGDAYNHIIISIRGTAFIGAGIVSALLGVGSLLSGVIAQVRSLPRPGR
jgi:hypothetical protein